MMLIQIDAEGTVTTLIEQRCDSCLRVLIKIDAEGTVTLIKHYHDATLLLRVVATGVRSP